MHKVNYHSVLKMGSGASSNVKNIQIDQTSEKYDRIERPSSSVKKKTKESRERELADLRAKLDACQSSLSEATQKSTVAEHETRELEKQMCELESANVDLKEQIQSLEEKLDYMNQQNLVTQGNEPIESLKLKDRVIEKLQLRTKEVEDEINALKSKYKKKVKRINCQLAESRQDSTLKLFELRDQLAKQSEEKAKLEERLSRANSASSQRGDGGDAEDVDSGVEWEDSRTKVILDLSRRVSDQSEKISSLEQQVKHKDLVIEQLKILLKENGISSEVDEALLGTGEPTMSEWKRVRSGSSSGKNVHEESRLRRAPSAGKGADRVEETNDTDSDLKSIAREMRRLKKRANRERKDLKEEDYRQSSSTSRDSGVQDVSNKPPSAGKTCRVRSGDQSQRISSAASSLSTVSEQDTDSSSHVASNMKNFEAVNFMENDLLERTTSQSSVRNVSGNGANYETGHISKKHKKYIDKLSADSSTVCVSPGFKPSRQSYSVSSTT